MYIKKPLDDTVRKLAWKNIVVDDSTLIDKRTSKNLGPKIDYTHKL